MPTTTIKTVTTTEIDVDNVEDVVNVLLNDENVTSEAVKAIQDRLSKIAMPWKPDNCHPPKYERRLANGKLVGLVDPFLGGYGQAHRPRHHGWGYKGNTPGGSGVCTAGIVKVNLNGVDMNNHNDVDDEFRQREIEARDAAMLIVDKFLEKEFPELVLLPGREERR